MIRAVAAGALALALGACGGAEATGGARVASASTRTAPTTRARPALHAAPGAALIQTIAGLEGVIGATSSQLARSFGPARLDVVEGDARKLQFTGTACVLDVYLYPPETGREPQATYVDARRPSDGRDVDRAACVAALRAR